jgi:hypothetical protein
MRNQRWKAIIALVLLVTASLACGIDGGGGEQEAGPTPVPENVIFAEDFDNANSGWEVGSYDDGSVGYKDGSYFVTSSVNGSTMWGVANHTFDNIIIDVDTTQVAAGPASNNDYGVVCREQGNGDGYYMLVSGDGYYAIIKAVNAQFEMLVEWAESSAVKTGNATNRIRAVCNGSTLEMYVNGQLVATAEDGTYARGDIALTATTYEDQATEIHFDNMVVQKP